MSDKRVFEDYEAKRVATPAMIGVVGPSGSGKTRSMLRLAAGLQRVNGGDVWMIDTEAKRGLHHADKFKFRHLPFKAPFAPGDYLQAIQHCVSKGARHIIIDSMSHEHEGPGGVLEMHAAEVERRAEAEAKRYGKQRTDWGDEKHNFPSWGVPKAERRLLINSLLQQECNFLFGFRAKQKTKMMKRKQPNGSDKTELVEQGWQAIAGEEFLYEMLINFLLLPGAQGLPTWQSEYPGERELIKVPEQFVALKSKSAQLSEEVGEFIGKWCAGGANAAGSASSSAAAASRKSGNEPAQTGTGQPSLTFSKGYKPALAGKPVESATTDEIISYQTYLQNILDDASKAKAHAAVGSHKDEVDALLDQLRAEEAMSGGAGDGEEAAE